MIDILTWLFLPPTIIFLVIFIVFVFLFIFMAMRTPMLTFFRANIRGKIIGMVYRRDRRISFIEFDLKGAAIDDREFGMFNVPEDSVYNESKSGIPMVLLHSDVATGITPVMAQVTKRLHDMKIDDIYHAEWINQAYHKCLDCGHEGIADFKTELVNKETGKIRLEDPVCHECKSENLKKTELKIDVDSRKSMTLRYIKDYLSQINPIFIRSIKERDVDDERHDLKDFLGGHMKLVGIGMFIMILVVAVIIFLSYLNSQPDPASLASQCNDIWNVLNVKASATGV